MLKLKGKMVGMRGFEPLPIFLLCNKINNLGFINPLKSTSNIPKSPVIDSKVIPIDSTPKKGGH